MAPGVVCREHDERRLTANPWVSIETLDPGWRVTISLTGTALENVAFDEVEVDRDETDWIHCWVDGGPAGHDLEWQGRGGAKNLPELVQRFREWAEGPE